MIRTATFCFGRPLRLTSHGGLRVLATLTRLPFTRTRASATRARRDLQADQNLRRLVQGTRARYFWPARTGTVFVSPKSRTSTTPSRVLK